jgi:hydrogenase expression/formation protein HypC
MCLGIPGQIVEITDPIKKLALVDVSGVKRQVNIACIVDEQHSIASCIGDWVLVHVGFAMSRIDADEAKKTLDLLIELGTEQPIIYLPMCFQLPDKDMLNAYIIGYGAHHGGIHHQVDSGQGWAASRHRVLKFNSKVRSITMQMKLKKR